MKVVVVAGAHGSGKTSLLMHVLGSLRDSGMTAGVFEVDALDAGDDALFRAAGFPSAGHAAGDVCPDHETMVVLGKAWNWARSENLDVLCIETAGLCHRCSPFLKRALAVCVVSGLSHVGTPESMRPLIEYADCVVLTKASLISPAERQIFLALLRSINRDKPVVTADGLSGEGVTDLVNLIRGARDIRFMEVEPLRTSLPTGFCHYCQGAGSGHG